MSEATFATLNFDSAKPIGVPMETIIVTVGQSDLFDDFSHAFIREATRVNPELAKRVGLTKEELTSYIDFLLHQRILSINDECTDYRIIKRFYAPCFIEYMLRMIGKVVIRNRGLTIIPECEKPAMTLDEAKLVSEKIGMFVDDLQIVQNVLPTSIEGDVDVMSSVLLAGYVRSMQEVKHVASTYVTAFANFQLKNEAAFRVLYRVQYDDIGYIASAFTSQRGLY